MSMRIFRKGVKRGMVVFLEKSFNLIVVLALLLQPVGTVGLYGAFSFSKGVAVAADEEPASVAAEAEEKEVKKAEVESEPAEEKKTMTSEPEPEKKEIAKEVTKVEEEVPTGESLVPASEEEVVPGVVVPVEPVETVPVVEEILPVVEEEDVNPVVNEEGKETADPIDPVVVPEEAAPAEEVEAESEEIQETSTWQEDGKKATTSQKVVLGETYVAPQNDDVTVVFTKLPEHSGTLSIEEVKLSESQVAELGAFSSVAYDVTSSMENGTFEYVLTLPTPKDKDNVVVKYAEDVDGLAKAKTVNEDDVEQKKSSVEVTLDHFTLFVATYGDASFSVDKSEFVPGETIYLKATGLNDTKYYRLALDPPSGGEIFTTTCFNPAEGVSELTDSYTFLVDAVLGNWGAELKEYAASNCTGGHDDISDPFTLVAPEEKQHVDVTFCHATPPDTAANGYEQLTTDDDGILNQGHASQHSADIIPPFTVGETDFPGQNWTALGQAIWNNDCQGVGSLKAVKVVDDQSDLTQWSFQLDENAPIQANASGEVDFGYVSVGEHVITEIGVASYSVMGVSGEGCTLLPESSQAEAVVATGATTVCTFSNAVDKGSITIVKDAMPDDSQDFVFSVTNMEGSPFTLDDDGINDNEYSNTITFSSLWPGEYSVTEESVEGWELTGMNCVSSNVSLDMPVSATASITLLPGENVTCTYTNTKVSEENPVCGDGIVNQESEQCDGTDGVSEGAFCTFSCALVPVYDGGGSCSEDTEKVLVDSYFVSGTTNPDGISIPLSAGKEYVLEATGDYSYGGVATNHELNRADAGYSSDDNFAGPNLLNSLFGISSGAFYRGVHTLISDMGTGTFGVVDWGSYDASHVYPVSLTPGSDTNVRFMISDWYDTWYSGDWLSEPNKDQQGYRDNEGGLTVNVYECQAPKGSITVVKDAEPDHAQDFGFVLNPGFEEFVLDDDQDPLLSNSVTFTDLSAGAYTVTEGLVAGWELQNVSCLSDKQSLDSTTEPIRDINLLPGENVTCTFTNVARNSSITIIKDAQPDSAQNFGYAMNGDGFVEFVLDDDEDPLLSNTAYFSSLPAGLYTVTEGLVSGWTLQDISCTSDQRSLASSTHPIRDIDLLPNENVVCTFTNVLAEEVPVCGDGVVNTEGEQCDGTDGVTEGENFCTFSCKLVPIYGGGEVCSEGTEPVLVDTKFVESYMTENVVPAPVTVSLESGKEYLIESVGDFGYGGVATNNAVNRADAGYVTDSNWVNPNLDTLFGTPATALYRGIHSLISDMGTGTFGVVDWGAYNTGHTYAKHFAPVANTDVQFAISDWYDTWYSGDELSDFNKNQFGFRDNEGGLTLNVYECQPQEQEENPQLQLRKFNDSVGDETPGNEVVYTLEVTALDSPVEDVTVTDLPPEGFEYVAGSGEGAPFIHEYASPGIWDLGDMAAGETKVLTYKTKISGAQDAGLYKDLAFAKGVAGESAIFANSEADPFVGTQVNVVLDTTPTVVLEEDNENKIVEKTKKKTQYVLGAATMLPMTGTPLGMIELALAGLVAGLGLIFVARRRAAVLPTLVLLLVGGFALMPEQAAAANLSVKIETPEAVTDTPNIKIGFVTLDVLGRDLTVECYEGAAVTPFATYALVSAFGGNSGDCQVNGTVMPTDGNYEFYVKAIASGEGNETVESNHVSVTLTSATPGTPYNYDRSDASCQNVITFTTADDGGKTVKVELYRSTETTFVANAGTKVDEVAIGSNANGSFVEAAPGCSNDAFYALRAVAANGNGSGFVGDKDVNVDTHTVTKNKTTTVTLAGGSTSGTGAIPVSGGSGVSEGQVEGATTTNEETETPTSLEQNEPGSVLGEMTEASTEAAGSFWDAIKNHPWRSFFWLVIVVALGYFGYQSYRGKHDQSVQ